MIQGKSRNVGLEISAIESCDFEQLKPVYNEDILKIGREGQSDERLLKFIAKKMGIKRRFHCPDDLNSTDLARNALEKLLENNPTITEEAEFFILAGISNPMPTVCTSAFLAGDYGFKNASCWDIKSGCSTGILAMMQALDWFEQGAKKGVIICTETLSKFSNPAALQMSAATGDGAVAMIVEKSDEWQVQATVHGTDPELFRSIYVPGKYPISYTDYDPEDYVFKFEAKSDALERMGHYWIKSLKDLLELANVSGSDVNHYIAHQVDGTKNTLFAQENNIPDEAIAKNFENFGNMGCPTVFMNYQNWVKDHTFKKGDHMVLHAVGGGVSWAGIIQKKVK